MKRQEHIRILFQKYLDNRVTEAELKELLYHFNVVQDEAVLSGLIQEEMAKGIVVTDKDEVLNAIAESIESKLFPRQKPMHKISSLAPLIAAAAVLLIAFTVTAYFYLAKDKIAGTHVAKIKNDVPPGGNKATLILANGQKIDLSAARAGTLASQSGSVVTKSGNGQIGYTIDGDNNTAINYNTIQTPKGGEYQVVLPDGTKVWLNAASSLRYPTSFASLKQRLVELTGEAYFEVAHNKAQPFRVKTASQTIEVLGTHFNINCYINENAITTTLLEGSVKVSNGTAFKMLKPGQESIVNESIKIQEADLVAAVAWKNGRTYFKDADIQTIMRSLSRWYNIEIVYRGQIHNELFTGGISRKSNLSSLLKILSAGGIHATIEGRKLIVTP